MDTDQQSGERHRGRRGEAGAIEEAALECAAAAGICQIGRSSPARAEHDPSPQRHRQQQEAAALSRADLSLAGP